MFIKRYLDAPDRLNEMLFGLIMVLTFTLGAGLIVKEGETATKRMLLGILGCNTAWGIIDGAMFLMTSLFERSRKARLLRLIQKAPDDGAALAVIGKEFDHFLEPLTSLGERLHLYQDVLGGLRRAKPERVRLTREDVYGAFASFLLVFLAAIPAIVPFLLFSDRYVALRISNALLLFMLFLIGYRSARVAHSNPWILGSTLVVFGLTMVAVAMALGG